VTPLDIVAVKVTEFPYTEAPEDATLIPGFILYTDVLIELEYLLA
jgi:hypothetical protein